MATITDDDGPPGLSVDNATVTEGNSGTTNANFTVSLSPASGKTVTVNYATANGTAVAPADYTAKSSTTLTFNPGQTSLPVTVVTKGDTLDEDNETFTLDLSAPSNATLSDGQGVGTITDDDGLPAITVGDVTVAEGDSGTQNAAFTVTLSPASGRTVTVDYGTTNGTAVAPGDYTATSGTLTFAAGETTQGRERARGRRARHRADGELHPEPDRAIQRHRRGCQSASAPSRTATPTRRSPSTTSR